MSKSEAMQAETKAAESKPANEGVKVRWNTSNLSSAYANVCNVTSTREEVVMNFGVNKAWERGAGEMEIELSNRIILSPFAAKRLNLMLDKLIKEYEARHGELKLEVGQG
ncbi:MAG: DUF3467 domain-containing protein [Gammaproteobacteria bacterium]|jgi:hypothetical protein